MMANGGSAVVTPPAHIPIIKGLIPAENGKKV
jgi:hypothetical protein